MQPFPSAQPVGAPGPVPMMNNRSGMQLQPQQNGDLYSLAPNGPDSGGKRPFPDAMDDPSKRMRAGLPAQPVRPMVRATPADMSGTSRPNQDQSGLPMVSAPKQQSLLTGTSIPEKPSHSMVSEAEVFNLRTLVVDAMHNIASTLREKREMLQPEVHGFMLSRVMEQYLQRFGGMIYPMRAGVSSPKDMIALTSSDLCDIHNTAQQVVVLVPKPGMYIDESNKSALAGGPGLKAAMAAVEAAYKQQKPSLPFPSSNGSTGAGPSKAHPDAAKPVSIPGQSLMSGTTVGPTPMVRFNAPGAIPAIPTTTLPGPHDTPEEKSRKTLLQQCRLTVLHMRFNLYVEGHRLVNPRHPQPFGTRPGAAAQRAAAAPPAPSEFRDAALFAADDSNLAAGNGDGPSKNSGSSMAQVNHMQASGNKWPSTDLLYASDAITQAVQPYVARQSQRISDLRNSWLKACPRQKLAQPAALGSNLALLAALVELSEWVKDTCKDGVGPFHVTTPDGRQLEYGTLSSAEEAEWGHVKREIVMDGAVVQVEGGTGETARPVTWQFPAGSVESSRALTGTMARVRLQLLPAGAATEQAVELAAGACLLVPELGFLWDVKRVMDIWKLVHTVLAEHAYAAVLEKSALDVKGVSGYPLPIPVSRLRDEYRRLLLGPTLHVAPLGFNSLVEMVQWGPFKEIVAVEDPGDRDQGYMYPLFNPVKDLRTLLEKRLEELCVKEAQQIKSSSLPPGFEPLLVPEDGYRIDVVKQDFKLQLGYDLENVRLGFQSFKSFIDLCEDLLTVHILGSTILLLPTPLTRLRLLMGQVFSGPAAPAVLSVSQVEARYMDKWGKAFLSPGCGYASLLDALEDMADRCTLQGLNVVPPQPGAEGHGFQKMKAAIAVSMRSAKDAMGAASRRLSGMTSLPPPPPPPPRNQAGLPTPMQSLTTGTSYCSPDTRHAAGGSTNSRLPPHPSTLASSSPGGNSGSMGMQQSLNPMMRDLGMRADSGALPAAMDPVLAQMAASLGLDPVIVSMMADSMLNDPSKMASLDPTATVLPPIIPLPDLSSTAAVVSGIDALQQSLLAQGLMLPPAGGPAPALAMPPIVLPAGAAAVTGSGLAAGLSQAGLAAAGGKEGSASGKTGPMTRQESSGPAAGGEAKGGGIIQQMKNQQQAQKAADQRAAAPPGPTEPAAGYGQQPPAGAGAYGGYAARPGPGGMPGVSQQALAAQDLAAQAAAAAAYYAELAKAAAATAAAGGIIVPGMAPTPPTAPAAAAPAPPQTYPGGYPPSNHPAGYPAAAGAPGYPPQSQQPAGYYGQPTASAAPGQYPAGQPPPPASYPPSQHAAAYPAGTYGQPPQPGAPYAAAPGYYYSGYPAAAPGQQPSAGPSGAAATAQPPAAGAQVPQPAAGAGAGAGTAHQQPQQTATGQKASTAPGSQQPAADGQQQVKPAPSAGGQQAQVQKLANYPVTASAQPVPRNGPNNMGAGTSAATATAKSQEPSKTTNASALATASSTSAAKPAGATGSAATPAAGSAHNTQPSYGQASYGQQPTGAYGQPQAAGYAPQHTGAYGQQPPAQQQQPGAYGQEPQQVATYSQQQQGHQQTSSQGQQPAAGTYGQQPQQHPAASYGQQRPSYQPQPGTYAHQQPSHQQQGYGQQQEPQAQQAGAHGHQPQQPQGAYGQQQQAAGAQAAATYGQQQAATAAQQQAAASYGQQQAAYNSYANYPAATSSTAAQASYSTAPASGSAAAPAQASTYSSYPASGASVAPPATGGYSSYPAPQQAAGYGAYPAAASGQPASAYSGYPAAAGGYAAAAAPATAAGGQYASYAGYPGYPPAAATASAPATTATPAGASSAAPWATGTAPAAGAAPASGAGTETAAGAAAANNDYAQQWAAYYAAQAAAGGAQANQYGQGDPQAYAQYMQAYAAQQQQQPHGATYSYGASGSWPASH